MREIPTLQLLDNMARHLATEVKVYDPFVKRPIVDNQYTDFDQFLDEIDILVIMVGHQHIKQNIERIRDKIIFDTKNVIPSDKTYKL
ncbi:MAG: hypothetical protein GX660_04890 [Clostridiaceae bacterium]|nr:hypothetical protein [Clostridiaceae bacterium]